MNELFNGHYTRIFKNIQMDIQMFLQQCNLLCDHGVIKQYPNRKVFAMVGNCNHLYEQHRQRVLAKHF